jgi:hypothetical protein
MFKRIPAFALWVMLALGVGLIPLACGSDNSNTDSGSMTGG